MAGTIFLIYVSLRRAIYYDLSKISPPFLATRTCRLVVPVPSIRYPIRVATPPEVTIITFETAIELSRSAIPPLICFCGFGRVCRFTMLTPSTSTLPVVRSTCSTRPVLPLSRPAITFTVSSFLILTFISGRASFRSRRRILNPAILNHLRRKRHDLHEFLLAQLTSHRPEHARPDRLADIADQHRR